jgi:hypothetical protein
VLNIKKQLKIIKTQLKIIKKQEKARDLKADKHRAKDNHFEAKKL